VAPPYTLGNDIRVPIWVLYQHRRQDDGGQSVPMAKSETDLWTVRGGYVLRDSMHYNIIIILYCCRSNKAQVVSQSRENRIAVAATSRDSEMEAAVTAAVVINPYPQQPRFMWIFVCKSRRRYCVLPSSIVIWTR